MHDPRFGGLVVVFLIILGVLAYIGQSQLGNVESQVAALKAENMNLSKQAEAATTAADQAKAAASTMSASVGKLGDIAQLDKQAQDSADAATKSAEDAKQAAEGRHPRGEHRS